MYTFINYLNKKGLSLKFKKISSNVLKGNNALKGINNAYA